MVMSFIKCNLWHVDKFNGAGIEKHILVFRIYMVLLCVHIYWFHTIMIYIPIGQNTTDTI